MLFALCDFALRPRFYSMRYAVCWFGLEERTPEQLKGRATDAGQLGVIRGGWKNEMTSTER